MATSSRGTVTFVSRMKKSYRVTLQPLEPYANDREPHVETHEEGLEGKTFPLGKRTQVPLRNGFVAVTYDVVGVTNDKRKKRKRQDDDDDDDDTPKEGHIAAAAAAHITVYFGHKRHCHDY